jgi:hypothetical protein
MPVFVGYNELGSYTPLIIVLILLLVLSVIYILIRKPTSQIIVRKGDTIEEHLKEDEEQNKTSMVRFNMSEPEMDGGAKRRQTMKKRKNRRYTFSRTHMFPNIPEIQGWRYRDYLGQNQEDLKPQQEDLKPQ